MPPMADASDALARLRQLAESGELATFCEAHGVDLVVVFGSALRRDVAAPPRDLDVGLLFGNQTDADVIGAVSDLVGLVHSDALDVMDLTRAGVLARGRKRWVRANPSMSVAQASSLSSRCGRSASGVRCGPRRDRGGNRTRE